MSNLNGTLPVRPFHPDGFVGKLEADGQQVRVAALVCDEEQIVTLSLVGFDTSIGVVLARLWSATAVPFTPASAWQEDWQGPEQLKRGIERYKQCMAHLEGTREVHALAFLRTVHLTEGILHPPDLPEIHKQPESEEKNVADGKKREQVPQTATASRSPQTPPWVSRYLLGNWDESGPHRESFLGHLYALRVLFLHRHADHPTWRDEWAEVLWERGLSSDLITPLPALGLVAWKLSGNLIAWSELVGAGVREGWLPWRETQRD
jgi:hypothetical protein